jgi:hypothetical protein
MTQLHDTVKTMAPPDARSPVKEFEDHLRTKYVLSYARDMHFQRFGFEFIKTKADVDAFLLVLDKATRSQMSLGCIKSELIKAYLERRKPESEEDYIKDFKFIAARRRRTCCACHETGSYAHTPW